MLFPPSLRCEPSRIIHVTQVSGYPVTGPRCVNCMLDVPKSHIFTKPVICEKPMTPESVRCELYQVIILSKEYKRMRAFSERKHWERSMCSVLSHSVGAQIFWKLKLSRARSQLCSVIQTGLCHLVGNFIS